MNIPSTVKSEPADPEEAMAVVNDTAPAVETKDIKVRTSYLLET